MPPDTAPLHLLAHLQAQLQARDDQHLRRRLRVVGTSSISTPPLAFCSNDYLGLRQHPAVVQALVDGAQRYGAGSGASHLVSGHTTAHAALEDAFAAWAAPCIPGARALSLGSGYAANMAVLTALGDKHATIFSDKLNHASIVDGTQLAQAEVVRYPHANTAWLAARLAACTTPIKIIVTDAVFSMDGTIAPLAELLHLAQQHDAWLVVDDAHGIGVLGPQGRGTLAHLGLCSERFIYIGTFGKAVGVAGACVAAHPLVIDWLINAARTYIYTTAEPPALACAVQASLAVIASPPGDALRARLQAHVAQLRTALADASGAVAARGWQLVPSTTAIQPLVVGSNATAVALAQALEAQGIWVPAIRPPTVPVGTARLRIVLSAAHTTAEVEQLLAALTHAARTLPELAYKNI